MKLDEVMGHFLLDLRGRSRSRHTIVQYKFTLGLMTRVLHDLCDVSDLESVKVLHLRRCVDYWLSTPMRQRGNMAQDATLSVATVRQYVRVIKAFFNWCYQEELIEHNPVMRLASPKPPERVIATFKQEHIDRMLAVCDLSTEYGFRDCVVLLVLLDTGMRLSEIAGLRLSDVSSDYVKVFGKGRKEREIGVHPEVGKVLWKYIHKHRHPACLDETALFIAKSGKPLTVAGVKNIIERVKHDSGLEDIEFHAHVFRHTFAKWYLKQGGDLFKLSRELGHSNIKVTELYLRDFSSTDARKDHTSFSPISMLPRGSIGKKRKDQKRPKNDDNS